MTVLCTKCKREAEYDTPYPYCKFHWLEWWHADSVGELRYHVDSEATLLHLLDLIHLDHAEDYEKMEELYEKYRREMHYDD